MKRIGFLGAYSIDNTGDQVLGYAVRQALRARVPDAEHVILAPALRGDFWRHAYGRDRGIDGEIRAIPADTSTAWAKGLDAVIIGGGGLIRLEPDFRPFCLGEASEWNADIPAAWNAVGAESTPAYLVQHRPDYRAIKRCCDTLAYVSVRNPMTAGFVRRCGYAGELSVVQDPTMLLSLPRDGAGKRALEDAGVDTQKLVIGVSVGASVRDGRAVFFYKELFAGLSALAQSRNTPAEIAVFPFGGVYGDAEHSRVALAAIPGAKVIDAPLGALDRWALIGALDFHVCTRYHAMLAAFSQDVPFLVVDEYLSDVGASSKIREFVALTGLDAFYLCPYLSLRPAKKLTHALALADAPDFSFRAQLDAFRAELGAHYAAMTLSLFLS